MPAYLNPIHRGHCSYSTCRRDADRILFRSDNAEISRWCNSHSEWGLKEYNRKEAERERAELVAKTNEHARRRSDKEQANADE